MLAPIDKHRPELPEDVREQVNINLKYEGYISRQLRQAEHFKKLEKKIIPDGLDYFQSTLNRTGIKNIGRVTSGYIGASGVS